MKRLVVVIISDWRDPDEAPPPPLLEAPRLTHKDLDEPDPVGETLAWALGRLDQPLPVQQLARRARMSRRHFDRRFREATGTTPATWLTHQRVLRARPRRTAAAWVTLMRRLGYQRYGAAGNDAGSMISPEMGRQDPDHVIAVHVT